MKKWCYFVFVMVLLVGCANPRTIDSHRLDGRYNVDFHSVVRDALAEEDDPDMQFACSVATLLSNSLDINIVFYGNGKGVLELDGWGISLVQEYLQAKLDKVNEFAYRIDNDSVLMLNGYGTDGFERMGVLRRLAGSYDYLQLVADDGAVFNLIKTTESGD